MADEHEHPDRLTDSRGELVPPLKLPPTATGAGAAEPDGGRRVIFVADGTTAGQLAELMEVPPGSVIATAFRKFARLLTVNEALSFVLARDLAAGFGFEARPPGGEAPPHRL